MKTFAFALLFLATPALAAVPAPKPSIASLERLPAAKVESAILRAQGHMARQEFGPAKTLLQEAKQRFPNSVLPRVVLSHALLQEDRDLDAAESALREVLALDPNHVPTMHNLRVLMHRRGLSAA